MLLVIDYCAVCDTKITHSKKRWIVLVAKDRLLDAITVGCQGV